MSIEYDIFKTEISPEMPHPQKEINNKIFQIFLFSKTEIFFNLQRYVLKKYKTERKIEIPKK